MRITALIPLAALACAQAPYGQGAPSTTIDTTSTATVVKTVYAATHTTTVMAHNSTRTAASSGFAKPTGNASVTSSYPIAISPADAVKVNAAQGALMGALVFAALLF